MATNQESLQASLRARSGSTKNLTFNGDWVAVFDFDSIPAGQFNERLLNWINARLSTSYTSLLRAQSEFAASLGVVRWSDLTTIGAAFSPVSLFTTEQGFVYDFTNSSTVFQERTGSGATTPSGNGGVIGTLKDLSPNNNFCIAPTDAQRPLWNSAGYALFDGVDDGLVSLFTITQPMTEIINFRLITSAAVDIVSGGNANANILLRTASGAAEVYSIFAGGSFIAGNPGIALGSDGVITSQYNGASSRIAINNGSYVTGDAGSSVGGGVTLAARTGAVSNWANARITRIVRIAGLMSDSNIALCRTWAGAPSGLVL